MSSTVDVHRDLSQVVRLAMQHQPDQRRPDAQADADGRPLHYSAHLVFVLQDFHAQGNQPADGHTDDFDRTQSESI